MGRQGLFAFELVVPVKIEEIKGVLKEETVAFTFPACRLKTVYAVVRSSCLSCENKS